MKQLLFQLLQQSEAEVHHADTALQHHQRPHLPGDQQGEAVEVVGHEPLEHPGLARNVQLGEMLIQIGHVLLEEEVQQVTIEVRHREPVLEEAQQQEAGRHGHVDGHPERFLLGEPQHQQVAHDEVDALGVAHGREVQCQPLEQPLEDLDALFGLEELLSGEGALQVLLDLREAGVFQPQIDGVVLLRFIEIVSEAQHQQLPFHPQLGFLRERGELLLLGL